MSDDEAASFDTYYSLAGGWHHLGTSSTLAEAKKKRGDWAIAEIRGSGSERGRVWSYDARTGRWKPPRKPSAMFRW